MRCVRLVVPVLVAACATEPRVVGVEAAADIPFERLADELAAADVVVLGEEHDSRPVHAAHLRLLRRLHARRPDLVVSMEMFARDVQPVLDRYLRHDCDEDEFLAAAQPWPNYATDYRPVIEFARAQGIEVIAGNVPRELAGKVARSGLDAAAGSPYAARETSAPEDDYWVAFQAAMAAHRGVADAPAMRRFYAAQCLEDDTMAESIADRLARSGNGRRPLVVHICGRFHSDYRRGVVARLHQRLPSLRLAVLSVAPAPPRGPRPSAAGPAVADYLLIAPGAPAAAPLPEPKAAPPAPGATNPAGARPGLGLLPDYQFGGPGLRVDDLAPGGPAAKAGIEPGDVIVRLGDVAIEDVAGYAAALEELRIGAEVEVTVRRHGAELRLSAVVGARNR